MEIDVFPHCEYCRARLHPDRVGSIFKWALWNGQQKKFNPIKSIKFAFQYASSSGDTQHHMSFCTNRHAISYRRLNHFLIGVDSANPGVVLNCWDERGNPIVEPFWPSQDAVVTI